MPCLLREAEVGEGRQKGFVGSWGVLLSMGLCMGKLFMELRIGKSCRRGRNSFY